MNATVVVTACLDVGLIVFTLWCLQRSRRKGASLRLRIFAALAIATLVGALATGLFAMASDPTIGASARLQRVVPKAFLLSAFLLPLAAAGAAVVGKHLARSMEELTDAAAMIAEGRRGTPISPGTGGEAKRLARALTSLRREVEGKPYAAAFLRDAWHDLKTPVAALRATLEVLEDGALDDPIAARRFVANMRTSTDQIDRTLEDLVTLARYETATLHEMAPAQVSDVVKDAVLRVEPLAQATGVTVTTTVDEGARRFACDEGALARAIGNLLENAVHASPGGAASVALSSGSKDALIVDVTNEPAVVPPDVRHALFERSATSRARGGSGLGLAIARAAVEAHGGRVRFVEMGPPRVRVRVEIPRG